MAEKLIHVGGVAVRVTDTDEPMQPEILPPLRRNPSGPYSRWLRKGLWGAVRGDSAEGRFLRDYEEQMVGYLGGEPTVLQLNIIRRLAVVELRLRLFDEAMLAGKRITHHDTKVYGALTNNHRLLLRDLTHFSQQAEWLALAKEYAARAAKDATPGELPPTLAEYFAEKAAEADNAR